jgi:hypothetical protein
MTRDSAPERGQPTLPEDAAHRLLARAVELDAHRVSQVSVAQLREIAREAGIAPEAFDEALAELRSLTAAAAAPPKPGLLRAFQSWSRTIYGGAEVNPPRGMWTEVTINVLAFVIFWVVLSAFSRTSAAIGLDWPANHAGNIIANLIGLGVALRLRARVTGVVLGVTAAAQLAEYVMHLLFGIQTVQGGPTKLALMLAGLLGIAFGAVLTRWRKPPAHELPHAVYEGAGEAAARPSTAAPDQAPPVNLRLRPI